MKYVKIEGGKKLGTFVEPMLATLTDQKAFDGTNWVYEIKWDGYRAVAEVAGEQTKLYSRNGLTFDKAYAKVFDALRKIGTSAIIDGEIVVYDESGKPSFQMIQNYKNSDRYLIQYQVFDCLEYKGKSVTHLPLLERKALLHKIIPESLILKVCDHIADEGKLFFNEIQKMGLEGMIAKRKTSKYLIGKRSTDWLKIKNVKSLEAIIVGFTAPKGSRSSFGSLMLARREGKQLISIGNVGTGFSDATLKAIYVNLKPLIRKTTPLTVRIKETVDMTWVDPLLVCNIDYAEFTEEGSVRHPVFQGLVKGKTPNDLQLPKPEKKRK